VSRRSELLEEGAEPFEVAPGALLGAPLVAALRVLFARAAAFADWHTLDDALEGWPGGRPSPEAPEPVQAARAGSRHAADPADDPQHSPGGHRVEGGANAGRLRRCQPRAADAQPRDTAAPEAGSPGVAERPDGDTFPASEDEQLGSVSVAAAASFLPPAALNALAAALRARLSSYAAPRGPAALAQAAAAGRGGRAAREAASAARAASVLVQGEAALLRDALAELDAAVRWMPAWGAR